MEIHRSPDHCQGLQYVHRSVGMVCLKKRGNKLYYIIVSYLHTIYNCNTVIYYINNNNNNIQASTNILNIYDCYVTWQTSNDLAF